MKGLNHSAVSGWRSQHPRSFSDLTPTEQLCVSAMRQLQFGRYERVQIRNGEFLLPFTGVQMVKFGSEGPTLLSATDDFELKRQVIDLIEQVRMVASGEIRCLEVKHGLPFSMEVETRLERFGDPQSA